MKHLNDRKLVLHALASALSFSILAAAFFLKNQFGLYPLHRLIYLPLLLVLALPFMLLAANWVRFVWPIQPSARREVLLIALVLLPLMAWFLPLPLPALPARHQLQLIPAPDTRVEILSLTDLTGLFFPHQPFAIALLALAALAGTYMTWRASNPLWVLQAILLLTIYPMMFIVWHGEPLEIERHAMQIMLQFYLAGWMGVAVLSLYGFRAISLEET